MNVLDSTCKLQQRNVHIPIAYQFNYLKFVSYINNIPITSGGLIKHRPNASNATNSYTEPEDLCKSTSPLYQVAADKVSQVMIILITIGILL